MSDWLGFIGRRAVVVGGGSGIGRATALALATEGVLVTAVDRDAVGLAQTRESSGETVATYVCDVTSEEELTQAAEAIGPCDILVNSAGILRPGGLADVSVADWDALLRVNLTGFLLTSRAFSTGMTRGGSLIHVASISAHHAQGLSGAYSASKAGVVLLSQQLALEWGPRGIRSNTVSPGMVRTPMTEEYYLAPGVAVRRDRAVPVGRVALPEDVADVIVFLASDRARYISGADIVVDGGFTTTLMSSVPRPGFE
ncbi:MAG: SDR family oxidoreductase [Candidatus Nanopelagicales bacterium]